MNVYTTLFTSTLDPQRGVKWECDPTLVETLARSVERLGHTLTILHDEPPIREPTFGEWVRVERRHPNVYFDRWHAYRDALAGVLGDVWCVDGTDVEMLATPNPGGLYVGSETHLVANPWLVQLHPTIRGWIEAHPRYLLLNAGLAGGDAMLVRDLAAAVAARANETDTTDMGAFNVAAYERSFRTGPPIHTVYKAEDFDNTTCWWRHK